MKRVSLFLLVLCFLLFSSCFRIQRPEPWKLTDQNPNDNGFVFVKIEPTVNYTLGRSFVCRSMWSMVGVKYDDPKSCKQYGIIETPYLIEGKYFLYPLKNDRLYMLGYAAGIVRKAEKSYQTPYYLQFEMKPGEIAYMGSFNPNDNFQLVNAGTQQKVIYSFTKMNIEDDYNEDISWLKSRYPSLITNYQIKNYFPEIRDIEKKEN